LWFSVEPVHWELQFLNTENVPNVLHIWSNGAHLPKIDNTMCKNYIILAFLPLIWTQRPVYQLHITPHIWLIWSHGIPHVELHGLPLPTFCLLLVVTSHLVLEIFVQQLLLSGIVSPLTSVLAILTTFHWRLFSIQPLPLPSDPSQHLWFVHDYGTL